MFDVFADRVFDVFMVTRSVISKIWWCFGKHYDDMKTVFMIFFNKNNFRPSFTTEKYLHVYSVISHITQTLTIISLIFFVY